MDLEDLEASLEVREPYGNLAVKAAGTEERGVQDVRTVGRGDDDDSLMIGEAVHLHQHLVEGLLALVVAACRGAASAAADRIDLIDEDDAWGLGLGLGEHLPHA